MKFAYEMTGTPATHQQNALHETGGGASGCSVVRKEFECTSQTNHSFFHTACCTGWRLHRLVCWSRARFARNFLLSPPSMTYRLLHRLVAAQVSLLEPEPYGGIFPGGNFPDPGLGQAPPVQSFFPGIYCYCVLDMKSECF